MSGDDFSANEKQWLEEFSKLSIFDYFGRFDHAMKFLKLLCVTFFLTTILTAGMAVYFYADLVQKTKEISEIAKTTQIFLRQQELQSMSVFAVRVASDYFSMSHFNSQEVLTRLSVYLHPANASKTMQELAGLSELVQKGQIIQNVESIALEKLSIRDAGTFQGAKQFFITAPVIVRATKDGGTTYTRYEAQFGIYLVQTQKTISNPFGMHILQIGKLQNDA